MTQPLKYSLTQAIESSTKKLFIFGVKIPLNMSPRKAVEKLADLFKKRGVPLVATYTSKDPNRPILVSLNRSALKTGSDGWRQWNCLLDAAGHFYCVYAGLSLSAKEARQGQGV